LTGLRSDLGADLVKTGIALKLFVNFFGLLLLLAVACDPGEYTPPELGTEYFPLRTGFYQIYSVERTDYQEDADPATTEYEMLVEVVDSFPSTSQEFTYVIHRSTRATSGEAWTPLDTWSARKNDRELVVNEGNVPYLKLVFPVREHGKWNHNKYNRLNADEYEIVSLKDPFQLPSGTTFDNTLTVKRAEDPEFVLFQNESTEVYAKDYGMIFKDVVQLHFCYDDDCKGQQIIETGFKLKQWLKEYGMQ
jgi:hypothetical protein